MPEIGIGLGDIIPKNYQVQVIAGEVYHLPHNFSPENGWVALCNGGGTMGCGDTISCGDTGKAVILTDDQLPAFSYMGSTWGPCAIDIKVEPGESFRFNHEWDKLSAHSFNSAGVYDGTSYESIPVSFVYMGLKHTCNTGSIRPVWLTPLDYWSREEVWQMPSSGIWHNEYSITPHQHHFHPLPANPLYLMLEDPIVMPRDFPAPSAPGADEVYWAPDYAPE
jgi:hypothetical protein